MRRLDFQYDLPGELIAQYPLAERSASRLLCLDGDGGGVIDRAFTDLPELLRPGDLLVFNDTRVIPARLFGRKATGGRIEILVERLLDARRVLAHVRASKPPGTGAVLQLEQGMEVEVRGRADDLFELRFMSGPVLEFLERYGHVPLPPYVSRPDEQADRERYQTIYAREPGAVAAPTAGLHFDARMLERIGSRNVKYEYVTLHVGAGTFQPVRVDDIREHRMHAEYTTVSEAVCAAVAATKIRGGRVIAVGTTTVRALESAAREGELQAFKGETRLFIHPGYRFRVVDAMLTNFHLPESTLLMLVAAFGGYANVMNAYRHAVEKRYRFFSYGDAMFIMPDPEAKA